MKTFLQAVAGTALMLIVYHLSVGFIVINTIRDLNQKPLTFAQERELMVRWPVSLAATHYMAEKYDHLMTDILGTLEEINSGRWERKPE